MSFTPKKIEFIIMNDSAAELVTASKVTFIVSAENYTKGLVLDALICGTYYALLLYNIDGWINVVLSCERYSCEAVHDS